MKESYDLHITSRYVCNKSFQIHMDLRTHRKCRSDISEISKL